MSKLKRLKRKQALQKKANIRQFRSDVSDDIWQDGLRVVLQSVHRHSSGKLGSRGYLDFVSNFVF